MKTNKETVFLYHFEHTDRTKKLKGVLIRLGIRIRVIADDMIGQKVGYLAGVKGFELEEEITTDRIPEQEVMLMKDFSGQRIDQLLIELRKAGVDKIELKAVITSNNQNWSFLSLHEELMKENNEMSLKSE